MFTTHVVRKVGVGIMPEYLTTHYHVTLQSTYMQHHRCTAICMHLFR